MIKRLLLPALLTAAALCSGCAVVPYGPPGYYDGAVIAAPVVVPPPVVVYPTYGGGYRRGWYRPYRRW